MPSAAGSTLAEDLLRSMGVDAAPPSLGVLAVDSRSGFAFASAEPASTFAAILGSAIVRLDSPGGFTAGAAAAVTSGEAAEDELRSINTFVALSLAAIDARIASQCIATSGESLTGVRFASRNIRRVVAANHE
jgi:hypothetical protein